MSNKSFSDKVAAFFGDAGATAKSLLKIAVQSRGVTVHPCADPQRPLIVLGNGPSLNKTLEEESEKLEKADLLAVNFAANAPVFTQLKPQYYVLADPHFFSDSNAENLCSLRRSLAEVDWPMTLLVPQHLAKRLPREIAWNKNINVLTFNAVGAEGFKPFRNAVYGARLAMPRPRNVLIAALMCGLWLGYRRIYIVGADHSWMKSIWVDDNNRVVSVQPHFYKDNDAERDRVYSEYAGYHLHDIVYSFYVAFRAYHHIARFAASARAIIYNSTPGSFIDAFLRAPLP